MSETTEPTPTPFEHFEAKVAEVTAEPAPVAAPAEDALPAPFVGRTELTVIDYMKAWTRREIALHAAGRDTVVENP